MANTVTLLSYANTFGDWVVTTNKLAQENNDLAANNYVKPTGTLFLNSPTLGLQVANNAVVQGQLQVSGVGSSAYIQKNLQVDGSIIGAGNNYFIGNDSNPVAAITQLGTGLILRVNAFGNSLSGNVAAIDANGNVYIGSTTTGPNKLNVSRGNVNFANNLTIGQNTTSDIVRVGTHVASKDVTASANILGDRVQANTNLISPTLAVSGTAYIYYVQANSAVNTESLTVTSRTITGNLQANTHINSPRVIASSDVITGNLSANTSITVPTLIVNTAINAATADLYIDDIVANTVSVQGNFIINGDTVYNSDILTINADAASPQTGTFASHRGSGNANAEIRWNESQDYWDIRDVNNPTNYSKILTANLISDSLTSTSSSTIASSNAVYSVQNAVNSVVTPSISAVNTLATAAYGKANAEGTINNTQNTWITNVNTLATAAYGEANAESAINNTQNTWITNTDTKMQAAYSRANTSVTSVAGTGTANGISLSGTVTSTGSLTLSGSIPFPVSGSWFQGIPRILNTNGVMEIGRYIDFHNASAGTSDYDVRMDCTGSNALTFTGADITAGTFSASSDIVKKENIQTIDNALTKVSQMRGVSFDWKDTKKKSLGVIAQEVESIVPEIVGTDGDGTKTVSYDSIVGILIEAIKELKAEVDELKKGK